MKPTVGRIVHYVSYGTPGGEFTSQCRAAVVAGVGAWLTVESKPADSYSTSEGRPIRYAEQWYFDDALSLVVLNPTGQFFNECRHDGTDKRGGTWHWPERENES